MSPPSVHLDAQESLQCLRLQFTLMRRRACSVSVFSRLQCFASPAPTDYLCILLSNVVPSPSVRQFALPLAGQTDTLRGTKMQYTSPVQTHTAQLKDVKVWNDRFYWNFQVGPEGAKLEVKNVSQTFPQDAPEIERDSLFGPEGSNVQVKNVSLTIPPDALEKELTITIAISWNRSDLPKLDDGQFLVGPVVHCLPHGLYFKRPVKLSFQCEQKVMDMQVFSSDSDVDEAVQWLEQESFTSNCWMTTSTRSASSPVPLEWVECSGRWKHALATLQKKPRKELVRGLSRINVCTAAYFTIGTGCSNWVDFVKSGCEKSWAEVQADSFSFECRGCAKMKELEVELEELRLLVVAMIGREQGGCASSSGGGTVDDKVGKDTRDARENSPQPGRKLRGGKVTGHRETGRKETGRKGTGGKTTGVKERGVGETGGKEKGVGETGGKTTGVKERGVAETGGKEKGVGETGGKTTGVKERGVGETGGKEKGVGETEGKTTGVKERGVGETRAKEWEVGETGGKGSGQNVMEGIERKSYSAAVIEGVRKRARVFVGDSIVRKTDRVLNKGDDVVVCLPGAKIEAITERVKNIVGSEDNEL
ncbi:hypothetical protein LSAT2_028753 [Lamellibrachia satsuma]|nr:hypothetical protein LSAT2_028753 [Lamellibrachia satsuma]